MRQSRPRTTTTAGNRRSGYLLLGTGLAFASLILVPALATSAGLGPSLTGALRMALMKASTRAVSHSSTAKADTGSR